MSETVRFISSSCRDPAGVGVGAEVGAGVGVGAGAGVGVGAGTGVGFGVAAEAGSPVVGVAVRGAVEIRGDPVAVGDSGLALGCGSEQSQTVTSPIDSDYMSE